MEKDRKGEGRGGESKGKVAPCPETLNPRCASGICIFANVLPLYALLFATTWEKSWRRPCILSFFFCFFCLLYFPCLLYTSDAADE